MKGRKLDEYVNNFPSCHGRPVLVLVYYDMKNTLVISIAVTVSMLMTWSGQNPIAKSIHFKGIHNVFPVVPGGHCSCSCDH